jgi:hypothetical protein
MGELRNKINKMNIIKYKDQNESIREVPGMKNIPRILELMPHNENEVITPTLILIFILPL